MSNLDVAIDALSCEIVDDPERAENYRAAIRVLEAAGYVDCAESAIKLLKHSSELRYCRVIRFLETALPSEEPK